MKWMDDDEIPGWLKRVVTRIYVTGLVVILAVAGVVVAWTAIQKHEQWGYIAGIATIIWVLAGAVFVRWAWRQNGRGGT